MSFLINEIVKLEIFANKIVEMQMKS